MRVTVTPGTAAPDSSFTVPWMVDPALCAQPGAVIRTRVATTETVCLTMFASCLPERPNMWGRRRR